MNNSKTKGDHLDVNNLKISPVDLKEPSDIANEEVLEKKVYTKVNSIVNNLENKIHDASPVIETHQ